jgi:hypothetical protein
MIRKTNPRRRSRRQIDPSQRPPVTNAAGVPSIVATKLQLDFNLPMAITGTPGIKVNNALPTAIAINSATRITLTYATNVAVGQTWAIPASDPSMRTQNGGYVAAASGTF